MQEKRELLFGIHMHQPIDNFDWVIEHGVEVCYGPFFEVMREYPEFKFSLHCSGWLMQQIKKRHPKLYKNIKYLAQKGSIEFFSAGYYEPILSAINAEDRVAQIEKLNQTIFKDFGQKPQGLWLTERVWESALIPDIAKSGINYTVLDDYHFQTVGFDEALLDGYYMSEESGVPMGLFPISKKLRYAIPFLNVQSAIESIKSFSRESNSAAIIFDDAEKFGMWPGTYEWVYEKGWLKQFVEAVLADDSIETTHFKEYYEQHKPRGIAYLSNSSYFEMGEWSLRADDALVLESLKEEMGLERYEREGVKFLKGGVWKNFLVKYEESNHMHKRVLELSEAKTSVKRKGFNEALYKAQANDALWHGVFGGLYLPNLRDNIYNYIIEAENIRYKKVDKLIDNHNKLDGYTEVKLVSPNAIALFNAGYGAQLTELDSRAKCYNYQNTLTRRKEAYHELILNPKQKEEHKSSSEDGIDTIHHASIEVSDTLKNGIIYDWHLKNSFIDHISDSNFNLGNFKYANFREFGDFANQPFECITKKSSVKFVREGGIYDGDKKPTKLSKTYTPTKRGVSFDITLQTEAVGVYSYALEFNFHFPEYDSLLLNGLALEEDGYLELEEELELLEKTLGEKITLKLSHACRLYYFKLNTISQSEHGFDLTTQGVSFALVFDFKESLTLQGTLEINNV